VSSPAADGEGTAELAAKPPRLQKQLITAWVLLLLSDGAAHGYQLHRELDAQHISVMPRGCIATCTAWSATDA